MSTANVLKADHYRGKARDGKSCGNCKNRLHTIIKGKHLHWCYVHEVGKFPHLQHARIAPWMVCDRYGKGAAPWDNREEDRK